MSLIYLQEPEYLVQSGLGPDLRVSLMADHYLSDAAASAEIRAVVSITDASAASVPVQVTGWYDGTNRWIEIAAATPQPLNAWYRMEVSTADPKVILRPARGGMRFSLYSGDLVYAESLEQPPNPPDQDTVTLAFTQRIPFDLSWSGRLFADAEGNPLPACVPSSGQCLTTGIWMMHDIMLRFSPGDGAKLARFLPATMNAAYGHPARESAPPSPDASAPTSLQPLADGSLPIEFGMCEQQANPGDRCAVF
jgi:hypothetical protein